MSGESLPLWSMLPFALLLLAIAVVPLLRPHFWEPNRNKGIIAAVCGAPVFIYFLFADAHRLLHVGLEYGQFIVMLFALFTISGGIFLSGDIRATPRVNTLFLAVGAVLANLFGTTGAAMLLIRPLLRTNSERQNVVHIPIFFTFLVANAAGCLLPTADPPLFMGFLNGVPFFWTLLLWKHWLLTTGLILGAFYAWDSLAYAGETHAALERDEAQVQPLGIHGKWNLALIFGVVGCIAFVPSVNLAQHAYVPWREIIMLGLAWASLRITPVTGSKAAVDPRKGNGFTFHAITEVAVLFAGIFAAMIPALMILEARGGSLPVTAPWHFFFAAGTLSSFLDNAPTYLVFFALAKGFGYTGPDAVAGVAPAILQAISLGSVFMGAMTYIGNAPNFMVKSIADEAGVKMPSFGGYMLYSISILLPIYVIVNVVFFSLWR